MLSDNSDSQTAVSTSLGSDKYNDANGQLGERLVQQTSQCVSTLTPDYTKITDINVRKALAYAYPYEDVRSGPSPSATTSPSPTAPRCTPRPSRRTSTCTARVTPSGR